MFNVSGGRKGKAGMMEEKSASAAVPQVPTDSSGAAVSGTAGTTQVVDLIQPHSVSLAVFTHGIPPEFRNGIHLFI